MIERLNQLYQSLVQEHERMKHSLEEMRHWMSGVLEDYRRIDAENQTLRAEVERLQERVRFTLK
jgi:hypothetical protein